MAVQDVHVTKTSEQAPARIKRQGLAGKLSLETISYCRALRLNERLSLGAIAERANVAKSSASRVLRDIPLSEAELEHHRSENREKGVNKLRLRTADARRVTSMHHDVAQNALLSSDQKGGIAEAACIFRLKTWGCIPFIPLCGGSRIDVIAQVPRTKRPVTIQVKFANYSRGGQPCLSLTSRRGRYSHDEFDFYVAYDLKKDQCYVFSNEELRKKLSMVTLGQSALERWDKLFEMTA